MKREENARLGGIHTLLGKIPVISAIIPIAKYRIVMEELTPYSPGNTVPAGHSVR
jgi:hypothetical protein